MTIRKNVEKYISELTNEPKIDHSINFFESGLLSSLDFLDLISFIEESFKIDISDDDIGMKNFGSINGLVDFVEKQK
jgi:acyl carrier protein